MAQRPDASFITVLSVRREQIILFRLEGRQNGNGLERLIVLPQNVSE